MKHSISLSSAAFFVTLSIVGVVLVYVSRTLNKHDEEEWKWDFWAREFVNGPPGYQRAVASLLGYVLTIVGVIGIMISIVS